MGHPTATEEKKNYAEITQVNSSKYLNINRSFISLPTINAGLGNPVTFFVQISTKH